MPHDLASLEQYDVQMKSFPYSKPIHYETKKPLKLNLSEA